MARGGTALALMMDEQQCRACLCLSLIVDWARGDRVCTSCGVVDEERLRDSRPEWRDYNNELNEDNNAGAFSFHARCGLVAVDETKYVGGLQPTTLSKHAFGGDSATATAATTRKNLLVINRKLDRTMIQMHRRALNNAKYSIQCEKRKRDGDETEETTETDTDSMMNNIRPDLEQMLLQEEEDANRTQAALSADKWSLHRAIRLYGTGHEIEALSSTTDDDIDTDANTTTANSNSRLDATLQKALLQLYRAYTMLTQASSPQKLNLPDRVVNEATQLLCRYAARKDGLSVRGITTASSSSNTSPTGSSTMVRSNTSRGVVGRNSISNSNRTSMTARHSPRNRISGIPSTSSASLMSSLFSSPRQENEARAARRSDLNSLLQSGALCAALLFYTSRHLGCPRTLAQVCASISKPTTTSLTTDQRDNDDEPFVIQKKHCSRAMNQVKEVFPDLARAAEQFHHDQHVVVVVSGNNTNNNVEGAPTAGYSTSSSLVSPKKQKQIGSGLQSSSQTHHPYNLAHFTEQTVRKLRLPPVAEAALRTLVYHYYRQQQQQQQGTIKLQTVCAGLTYFVCHAGSVMQRLAFQATRTRTTTISTNKKRRTSWYDDNRKSSPSAVSASSESSAEKNVMSSSSLSSSSSSSSKRLELFDDITEKQDCTIVDEDEDDDNNNNDDDTLSAEQRAYEMGRVWDAWAQQTPWIRSLAEVEQSCGVVARGVVWEFYRKQVYPKRHDLLTLLKNAVLHNDNNEAEADADAKNDNVFAALKDTPLASVLLPQIVVASSLLKAD